MGRSKATDVDRRAYKREWARKWRKANPDKERANQERYWARRLQRQQLVAGRMV